MNLTTEQQNLAAYRAELETAEKRWKDSEADVVALRHIVAGMERRIAKAEGKPMPDFEPIGQPLTVRRLKRDRKPSLRLVLQEVMADGETRDLEAVIKSLSETPAYAGSLPARRTIVSRLWDLSQEGYLESPQRGVYRRSTSQNGHAPEGMQLARG